MHNYSPYANEPIFYLEQGLKKYQEAVKIRMTKKEKNFKIISRTLGFHLNGHVMEHFK